MPCSPRSAPREDEMQRDEGLSRTGRSGDKRRGSPPVTVSKHVVEDGNSRGDALASKIVRVAVVVIGQTREDVDAVARDPIGVLAGDEPAAAEFQDLEDAGLAIGVVLDAERDDRVRDGELGSLGCLGAVVLADPERGGLGGGQVTGQVMEEPAERSVVGSVRPERLEAVDHHEGRTPLPEQFDELGQHIGEPAAVQALAEVLVDDARSDDGLVEES